MKAGREIDALIAKKIFKIKVKYATGKYSSRHPTRPNEEWKIPCDGDPYYTSDSENPGGYYLNAIPAYSTDIAAAWTVVEKLWGMSEGGEVKVSGLYDGLYYCTIEFHGSRTGKYFDAHDTAPMAICLAALKTMEKK